MGTDSRQSGSANGPGREAASDARAHGRASARTVEEAITTAIVHARGALAEGLLAARALLEALSLALFGEPVELDPNALRGGSDARLAIASIARGIDELALLVATAEHGHPEAVLSAVLEALDGEIARWEARSREDRDARAVLRAFLGLREILWEFGVRHSDSGDSDRSDTPARQEPTEDDRAAGGDGSAGNAPAEGSGPARRVSRARRGPPRVQRVKVEG